MTIQSLMRFNYSGVALSALFAGLMPFSSHAALGEPESTAAGDAQQLGGSIKSMQRTTYRVHQIQLPSGTALREYAALDGTVFAVAWKGPALPDLRQALGRYFDFYVGAQQAKRGRGPVEIRQDGLIVQSRGRMRAFSGRAYLAGSIPAGTSLDDLR